MCKPWLAWLPGVAVGICACMDAPGHDTARPGVEQLAADGGGAWSSEAGPAQPPLGQLPDASWCGQLSEQPRNPSGPDGRPIAPGTDASVTGEPGVAAGLDAGAKLPAPAHAGDLIITELLADPGTLRDTQGEWFELYNPGEAALDLRGCVIGDGGTEQHAVAEQVLVQPGAYLTVARDAAPGFTPGLVMSFSFTNLADRIVVSCGGVEIDHVAYDHAQGFPIKAGASAALDPGMLDAQANDVASGWCLSTASYGPELGTPGAANAPCAVASVDAAVPMP